jgi:hypothetical protein
MGSIPSESARRATSSAHNWSSWPRSLSNRSAQTCSPVSVEMSRTLTVTVSPVSANAAFERVADAEFAPDLSRVDRFTLASESAVACDDEAALPLRKAGRQVSGETVSEILLAGIAAQVLERQHNDGEARRRRDPVIDCGNRRHGLSRS